MDATLLTSPDFWSASEPYAASSLPDLPPLPILAGHVLFQTSGTTAAPKWVALSKQALLISATAVNDHLRVTPDSRWGLALPLHHVGGFGVAARAYQAGCLLAKFDTRWQPTVFRDWLATEQVSHTSLVPTQVHDLVLAGLLAPASLIAVVVGGGHLDARTGQAARDLGWPILASYGMTEAGSQIATQALAALAFPYQAAPIPLLPLWAAEVRAGGLLAISGAALFTGYLSHGIFTARESEWFLTSDQAILQNHAITPLGRGDTQVKILGELVDPAAIEHELETLSQGRLIAGSFAVVALPDERAGHILVPVFESSVDEKIIEAVLTRYETGAVGYRRLKPPQTVASFPRSPLGKLRRAELTQTVGQQSKTP
jgi:o-succinylbenzoate---CoA ligase